MPGAMPLRNSYTIGCFTFMHAKLLSIANAKKKKKYRTISIQCDCRLFRSILKERCAKCKCDLYPSLFISYKTK